MLSRGGENAIRDRRIVRESVGRELHRRDDTQSGTNLGHEPVRSERRERGCELRLQPEGAHGEPLAFHDVEVRVGGRRRRRMPRVRVAVAPDACAGRPERLADARADDDAAQREVPGGDALRERDEIRVEPESRAREPVADAAEAADDLVRDEEDVPLAADAEGLLEVPGRREQDTACPHDRLAEEPATLSGPTASIADARAEASFHGTWSMSPASGPTPTVKTSIPTSDVP